MSRGHATARRLGVAGACLVVGCLAIGAAAGSPGKGRPLLPNIDQARPTDLRVRTAETKRGPAFRLGFTSRIVNQGKGPLVIRSTRTGDEVMRADQVVNLRGGGRRTLRRNVASVRYIRGRGHQHWHVQGLERFELRTLAGHKVDSRFRKQGLCLGDREPAPGEERLRIFRGSCGLGRPGLRSLEQGLSPGWTDPYLPSVEGQEIDITHVRAGRYVLVHRADPENRLAESDESDNAASVAISIGRAAAGEPPPVEVLRTCPGGARCRLPG